jgi:hypothetical protein
LDPKIDSDFAERSVLMASGPGPGPRSKFGFANFHGRQSARLSRDPAGDSIWIRRQSRVVGIRFVLSENTVHQCASARPGRVSGESTAEKRFTGRHDSQRLRSQHGSGENLDQ